MKRRGLIPALLLSLSISAAAQSSQGQTFTVRFLNLGDPNPYCFTLAGESAKAGATSAIADIPKVPMGRITPPIAVRSGTWYVCGSYDQKQWGYNNEPVTFDAGREYLIIRVKPGEGYRIIDSTVSRPEDEIADLDAAARKLDTPEKIAAWMRSNFTSVSKYGQETGDQTPDDSLRKKSGNCLDQAILAFELMKRNGVQVVIEFVQLSANDPRNHAVCVFPRGGKLYKIDNFEIAGPFNDYRDLAQKYDAAWWRYAIFASWEKAAEFKDPAQMKYRK